MGQTRAFIRLIKILLLSSMLFSFQVFAIDAPQNIKLEKAYEDSLDISWDQVEGAGAYAVSYGTKSVSGTEDSYEHELEVVVSEPKAKIENLNSDTTYYITIKAYDDEQNESEYSEEVSFNTLAALDSLKIENVELLDTRNMEIKFNLDLNKDSIVDINLVNTNDEFNSISIDKYSIEKNVLKIFLSEDLQRGAKYTLTILAIEGANGETIKEGVNGETEFDVPEDLKVYSEEEQVLDSAGPEEKQEEEKTEETQKKVLGGKDLENSKNENQIVEKVAKDKKKLPTTGPAETFLFLVFAFLASGLFLILRKKIRGIS